MSTTPKTRFADLAVFGGAPAFTAPLHVGAPNIPDRARLLDRIEDVLDRRWLTNDGPCVRQLEKEIEERLGIRNCVSMCNGTVALEIASRALGFRQEVIVPSFTFVATAHALQWQEITPVFCDVETKRYTIDPEQVERLITPRTTGLIGVHLWGRSCDVDALSEIARRHGLRLLFDAAHAFDCSNGGRMIGNFGDAEIFSFHATKFFNTFEGGAVVTNDDELAQKMRWMRNFGFSGYDKVVHLGVNGKMMEIAAAMGLASLESLSEFVAVNKRNYEIYHHELAGLPGVRVMEYDEREKNNFQYVVLDVDHERSGIDRDGLLTTLHAENVLARRYFYPGCHRMEPYRSYFPHAGLLLPRTEQITKRVLSLPTGTSIDGETAKTVARLTRLIVENGPAVLERLRVAHGEA